jgi:hypothetical protein
MSDPVDAQIDEKLRSAGEAWRTRRPNTGTSVDPASFGDSPPRRLMPALVSATAVVTVALIAVLVIVSLPPSNQNPAAASPSPPPSTSSTAPDHANVFVTATGDTRCFSIGGCGVFLTLTETRSPVVATWGLEPAEADSRLPVGASLTLVAGRYLVRAHLDAFSDVISNDEPRQHHAVAECQAIVYVGDASIEIGIEFLGTEPCTITVNPDAALLSPEPTVEATPRPTLAPAVSATPTPSSTLLEPPADAVRTVVVDGARAFDGFAQLGPRVVSVTDSGIALIDLEQEMTTALYSMRRREQILALDMSGDTVVWATGKYDGYSPGRAPCDVDGGLNWRIFAHTISTGLQREIVAGRNAIEIGCAAWAPVIATDGELLAYAEESSEPLEWQIVVRSIVSGDVVRTIDAGRLVAHLELDDGDVAYTTGVPSDPSNPYWELEQLRLMLSTRAEPEPVRVEQGFWSFSFAGGRMTWRAASGDSSGTAWTATVDDRTAVRIPTDAGRACSPRTSGALVSCVTMTDTSTTGNIWDARTGVTYQLEPGIWMDGLYTNGGRLVWYGDRYEPGNEAWLVQGIPLSEVAGLAP